MRDDRAEFELLLTVARLLRALLRDRHADYGDSVDVALLNEALRPFDPLTVGGGDFVAQPKAFVPGAVTYLDIPKG